MNHVIRTATMTSIAAYNNLIPKGTGTSVVTKIATALSVVTSTPVTEASGYIPCALYLFVFTLCS